MKYLIQLNHPAHYHLFKHTIAGLRRAGHDVLVVVRDKDVLLDLVQGEEVVNIAPKYRKGGIVSVLADITARDKRVIELARRMRPDVMVGTAVEITHAGRLLGIPSIFVGEDDVRAVLAGAVAVNPFCTHILSPRACDNWIWNYKTVFYEGFQKLAYLHPRYFTPDPARAADTSPYVLLRLSGLSAYHDSGRVGLSGTRLENLVNQLLSRRKVFISSERPLPPELEAHRLQTAVRDMHHVLYHASLFIGDSQSMAMEAAMLGVPNIRISEFVGRIGVLNEVENRYGLSLGFRPDGSDDVGDAVVRLLDPRQRREWAMRRNRMIAEKISVTDFMIWLLEEYPHSVSLVKSDPDIQLRFRGGDVTSRAIQRNDRHV